MARAVRPRHFWGVTVPMPLWLPRYPRGCRDAPVAAGSVRVLLLGLVGGGLAGGECGDEGFLRDIDAADRLHPLLTFLLPLEQLPLAGDVTAVALGEHVLADGADVLAGDDAGADGRLDGHLVLPPRDE